MPEMSEYAPGIPQKGYRGTPLETLKPDELVTYALQHHKTTRRPDDPHLDLRLGTPETNLFSWALPKARLPQLKEKLLAVNTELHNYGYGRFQGNIGKGYGSGQVKLQDYGKALVTHVSPRSIHFTLAHARVPVRYRLLHLKDDQWLMTNHTPTGEDVKFDKPALKLLTTKQLPDAIREAEDIQEKIDGAHAIYKVDDAGRMEVYSPRKRVTGEPITYTEKLRLGGTNVPEYADTELRGEVYGEKEAAQRKDPRAELKVYLKALLRRHYSGKSRLLVDAATKTAQYAVPSQESIFKLINKLYPELKLQHASGGIPDVGKISDVDMVTLQDKPNDLLPMFPKGTTTKPLGHGVGLIYDIPGYKRPVSILSSANPTDLRSVKHRSIEILLRNRYPKLYEKAKQLKSQGLRTEEAWTNVLGLEGDPYDLMIDKQKVLDAATKQAQQTIPFNELSGLLNSTIAKSLEEQKAKKIALKSAIFKIIRFKGRDVSQDPIAKKKEYIKEIMRALPKGKFTEPKTLTPEETTPALAEMAAGNNPRTNEGVVIDQTMKYKIRPDSTGYVVGLYPGFGKRLPTTGGVLYSDEPYGKAVGKIGSGFTDADIAEIAANQDEFVGRPFRFEHQGKLPSGNYRAPAFKGWETDKPNIKAATMTKEEPASLVPLSIVGPDGKERATIDAEVAESEVDRKKGLSGRKELGKNAGMLFVKSGAFWMKGVPFDIDILFLNKQGTVLDMKTMSSESSRPDLPIYFSMTPGTHALELLGGVCKEAGIKVGDKVRLNTSPK